MKYISAYYIIILIACLTAIISISIDIYIENHYFQSNIRFRVLRYLTALTGVICVALFVLIVIGSVNYSDWCNESEVLCNTYNHNARVLRQRKFLRAKKHHAYKHWKQLDTVTYHNPRLGQMRLSTYLKFKKQYRKAHKQYDMYKTDANVNANAMLPKDSATISRYHSINVHRFTKLFVKPSVLRHDNYLVHKAKSRMLKQEK